MSVESKHAYRFGYLKSEKWASVRLQALVRESGKCQICSEESIYNDAHHIWYPNDIYETAESHLVILCRPCHEFIHAILPECKTGDEELGRSTWIRFRNAIDTWRRFKSQSLDQPGSMFEKTSVLRKKYKALLKKYQCLHSELQRTKTMLSRLSNGSQKNIDEIDIRA